MARLTFARPTGWRLSYHRGLQWVGALVAARVADLASVAIVHLRRQGPVEVAPP